MNQEIYSQKIKVYLTFLDFAEMAVLLQILMQSTKRL